jgi:hypothetical protein
MARHREKARELERAFGQGAVSIGSEDRCSSGMEKPSVRAGKKVAW